MNRPACDRAPLVEAMFDGRLGPAERESTERHLKTCASCTELAQDLPALREILRGSTRAITPLEHQRARLSLLRQNARPAARRRRPIAWVVAAVLLFPVAAWAAVAALSPPRIEDKPRAAATTAPTSAKTPSGQKRDRIEPVEPPTPVPDAPVEAQDALVSPPPTAAASPKPHVARVHREPVGRTEVVAAAAQPSEASRAFAEAMQALSLGDFSAGARQLQAFVASFPHDPRVEDAVYLHAIALERAGRLSEARVAARRYLASYPDGAHHAQAKRIAGD